MRGPLFLEQIRNNAINLKANESLADLEEMYTILIQSRGKNLSTLNNFDERISLASMCQIHWPGKTPTYKSAVESLRLQYKGIATNPRLQDEFRRSVTSRFKQATIQEEINLSDISNIFGIQRGTSL